MVYTFDPTTCEEPKKPAYTFSPIPKTVECCCCSNTTNTEEEKPTEEVDKVSGTENEVVNETVPIGEQDG